MTTIIVLAYVLEFAVFVGIAAIVEAHQCWVEERHLTWLVVMISIVIVGLVPMSLARILGTWDWQGYEAATIAAFCVSAIPVIWQQSRRRARDAERAARNGGHQ